MLCCGLTPTGVPVAPSTVIGCFIFLNETILFFLGEITLFIGCFFLKELGLCFLGVIGVFTGVCFLGEIGVLKGLCFIGETGKFPG